MNAKPVKDRCAHCEGAGLVYTLAPKNGRRHYSLEGGIQMAVRYCDCPQGEARLQYELKQARDSR